MCTVEHSYCLAYLHVIFFFFFKQKTAYEIQGDWSSDVCSSDLYEQRASDVLFPSSRGAEIGRVYFSLFAPDTSSDGATVAITGIGYCSNTSSCVSPSLERYQTTIYSAGKPAVTAPGSGTLSGNGRYALLSGSVPDFFFAPYAITVLDLETGESSQYHAGPGTRQLGSRHRVANDGTIVIPVAGGLAVARGAQSQTIPGSASVLDSNGRCYAMIEIGRASCRERV